MLPFILQRLEPGHEVLPSLLGRVGVELDRDVLTSAVGHPSSHCVRCFDPTFSEVGRGTERYFQLVGGVCEVVKRLEGLLRFVNQISSQTCSELIRLGTG